MKGVFICPSSHSDNTETTDYVQALKGRVTVPGCMQRASSWWKARMSTPVNKNLELLFFKGCGGLRDLRSFPSRRSSDLVLDEVDVVRDQQMKVVPREL